MKKFALGIAIGASLVSTAAFAGEQRPTYLAFSAPAAAPAASNMVAPAAPSVAKRDKGFGSIPIFVPIVGGFIILGLIAAFTTGHHNNSSPG
jgi:F0F1-type ATP synthase membrane subunit c/vacuolar-type H+-ATPase subunit K